MKKRKKIAQSLTAHNYYLHAHINDDWLADLSIVFQWYVFSNCMHPALYFMHAILTDEKTRGWTSG